MLAVTAAMIDIILIILVSALIVHGFMVGVLRSLLFVASVVLAALASGPLGQVFSSAVADLTRWPLSVSYALSRLGAGVLIFVSLSLAAWQANRLWGLDKYGITKRWNRLLGAVGGLVMGLAISYVILVVLYLLNQSFSGEIPVEVGRRIRNSWAVTQVGEHLVPARAQSVTDILSMIETVHENPEILHSLEDDPAIRGFLQIPTVREALEDPEVRELIRERRWLDLLSNPKVKAMADDPAVKNALSEAPILSIIRRRIDEVRTGQLLRLILLMRRQVPRSQQLTDEPLPEITVNQVLRTALADQALAEDLLKRNWRQVRRHELFEQVMEQSEVVEAAGDPELIQKLEKQVQEYGAESAPPAD